MRTNGNEAMRWFDVTSIARDMRFMSTMTFFIDLVYGSCEKFGHLCSPFWVLRRQTQAHEWIQLKRAHGVDLGADDVVDVVLQLELFQGEDGPSELRSWVLESARDFLPARKRCHAYVPRFLLLI